MAGGGGGGISKYNLMVFLLTFWTILMILTNIFSYYLSGSSLIGMSTDCLKPYSECPTIDPAQDQENINNMKNVYYNAVTSILNVANQIPIVNLFVPLARITTMTYPVQVPTSISFILTFTSILTGVVIFGFIKEG